MTKGVANLIRQRAEVVALAAIFIGTFLLPGSIPGGIYVLGGVNGAALAIQTIGLVLVFRSNRLINFAQVQIGAVGALLFSYLAARGTFLMGVRALCTSCIDTRRYVQGDDEFLIPVNVPGWLWQTNYWLSMLVGIVVAVGLSYLAYVGLIRRFESAPRVVATLVTVGISQVCGLLILGLPKLFDQETPPGTPGLPWTSRTTIGGVVFDESDIATALLCLAALVAVGVFLRVSAVGVVLRGASENADRARTLGVNVASVTSLVWIVAGLLSGLAWTLTVTSGGAAAAGGEGVLVRLLAAGVIAGMTSVPIAVVASIVLGVLDQTALWSLERPNVVDGVLLVVIVAVLLLQRARTVRSDSEADSGWRATKEIRPIPGELRDLPVVRGWVRNLRVALVVLVLGLPWVLSPSQTNLAAVTMIYAVVALSLLVLTGWAGQISLGQFAFAAVGGFVTAWSRWPFPFSIGAGALVGALVAVIVGLPALRLRGLHLAISTLAFALATTALLLSPSYAGKWLPDTLERPVLVGIDLDDQRSFYYVMLGFLVLFVVATMGMRRSRTGRALIACRDNESAAQSFGINLLRARLGAFAVSGFMAAFAGGLYAYSQYGVKPSAFTVGQSTTMFLIVVIGGMGSIAGPVLGAAYYGMTLMLSSNALVALASTGLGVLVILLVLPGGLGDGIARLRDAMLRRVADRYRIDVPSLIADRRASLHRAGLAPKSRPGGGKIFVPERYRIPGQWQVDAHHKAMSEREKAGA